MAFLWTMLATEAVSLDLILSVGKAAALGALEVTGVGGGGGGTQGTWEGRHTDVIVACFHPQPGQASQHSA